MQGGSSGEAEAAPGGPELPFFKSLNLAPCPVALSPQRGHLSRGQEPHPRLSAAHFGLWDAQRPRSLRRGPWLQWM